VAKKNLKKMKSSDFDLTHSYSLIKDDLVKLKKDLSDAYRLAREQAKKQIEIKLDKSIK